MNDFEYYNRVYDKIENCFEFNDYVIAMGEELVDEGYDPAFPAAVMPKESIKHLTVERALQVHLPVVGENSQSVLMPMDFEIFLGDNNYKLYTDKEAQREYFKKTIPVLDYIKDIFKERRMPYLLDYTASGGHFLFHNPLNQQSSKELEAIGYLEDDLIRACNRVVPGDMRRHNGISLEAASVFSALGKLSEFISMKTMNRFQNHEAEGIPPVTISDTMDYCINLDNSWSEGSPHMRSIRSPFSLHKKNHEKYDRYDQPSLVDVIGGVYNGDTVHGEIPVDEVVECMWDKGRASEHAQNFTGNIPCANDSLIDFIKEYKHSDLYAFHKDFDSQADLPYGEAIEKAKREDNIPDWSRGILFNPNPSVLQPIKMIGFIYDFVIYANWQPKHVANILRDLYQDYSYGWTPDFIDDYPAEEKANFWTRTFSSVALWKNGRLNIES